MYELQVKPLITGPSFSLKSCHPLKSPLLVAEIKYIHILFPK